MHGCDKCEGDSIARWYRPYVGIRRNERVSHMGATKECKDGARRACSPITTGDDAFMERGVANRALYRLPGDQQPEPATRKFITGADALTFGPLSASRMELPLKPGWPSAGVLAPSLMRMADEPTSMPRSSDGPVSGRRASAFVERRRRSGPLASSASARSR
jgi:hypothetical protein